MTVLIAVYRAWPWRPRCTAARHVTLCRLVCPVGYCDPGNEG